MANFNCRVSGAVFNEQGQVLLLCRSADYIPESKEYIGWEFCGGGIEHDETPATAVEREYLEEAGITIKVEKLIGARTGRREGVPLLNLFYVCRYVHGKVKLTPEHIKYQWVELDSLVTYNLGPYGEIDKNSLLKGVGFPSYSCKEIPADDISAEEYREMEDKVF